MPLNNSVKEQFRRNTVALISLVVATSAAVFSAFAIWFGITLVTSPVRRPVQLSQDLINDIQADN